ncbi:MAG: hypothetical protein SWY16_04465 [Cyanobacteriota bacterium]|nr:hypothetical protein [Cyanobacteriota bacterium]
MGRKSGEPRISVPLAAEEDELIAHLAAVEVRTKPQMMLKLIREALQERGLRPEHVAQQFLQRLDKKEHVLNHELVEMANQIGVSVETLVQIKNCMDKEA